jgi:phosphoribosylaminoimidazole-succinocarboxamide synthase
MTKAILKTNVAGLNQTHSGKVRDLYEQDGRLLLVATDRVSAFDVILENGIPDKGKILTSISLFWFERFKDLLPNQLTGETLKDLGLEAHEEVLGGRTVICNKYKVVPIECIVRGYLAGSGFKDYKRTGQVCGITLPEGLQNSDQLPEPLFTPSTKAEKDENIDFGKMCEIVGEEKAEKLKALSLEIYKKGSEFARSKGLIIADTKFEFGEDEEGNIYLIDEVLTMDSSRFWPVDEYEPGREQNSFDKQIVRNYLETLDWDKTPPGPKLPQEIIDKTRARYCEVYERLTGEAFDSVLKGEQNS